MNTTGALQLTPEQLETARDLLRIAASRILLPLDVAQLERDGVLRHVRGDWYHVAGIRELPDCVAFKLQVIRPWRRGFLVRLMSARDIKRTEENLRRLGGEITSLH